MYPKFLNERFSHFCRRIENMHFKVKRPSKTTLCDVMVFRWRLLTGLFIFLNHMSILYKLQSNVIFMQWLYKGNKENLNPFEKLNLIMLRLTNGLHLIKLIFLQSITNGLLPPCMKIEVSFPISNTADLSLGHFITKKI